MSDNKKQSVDFEKQFIENKLIELAQNAALEGISFDVFEALLINLADELNFKEIMTKMLKEKVQ